MICIIVLINYIIYLITSYIYIYIFFSIGVFFHNHSRFTGLQGKGEGIFSTPHYHFHPLHRHLDISQAIIAKRAITAERLLIHDTKSIQLSQKHARRNVPSRLSLQLLCGNSRTWAHDVRF